jgi:hypothetical protein
MRQNRSLEQSRASIQSDFALALFLILGKSGGIVGRACLRLSGGAAFGLCLAALEVFPQRRPQALLLPCLLRAFRLIVHDDKTTMLVPQGYDAALARERARHAEIAWSCTRLPAWRPYGKDRAARGRIPCFACSQTARRCRSSVVEHPLGKGEVVSSILPGSTILESHFTHRPACSGTTTRTVHRYQTVYCG